MDLIKIMELAKKFKADVDIKFDPVFQEVRVKIHKGDYHRAIFWDYKMLDRHENPSEMMETDIRAAFYDVANTDLYLGKKEEE